MNLPACCMDLELELKQLLFPQNLSPDDLEFIEAHGLGNMTLTEIQSRALDLGIQANGERKFRLRHRCAQLMDDGRCGIYETRPAICRAFDCSTRTDCACNGQGWISVDDLTFENA
jgi:Fe-S-cluster containining protein